MWLHAVCSFKLYSYSSDAGYKIQLNNLLLFVASQPHSRIMRNSLSDTQLIIRNFMLRMNHDRKRADVVYAFPCRLFSVYLNTSDNV